MKDSSIHKLTQNQVKRLVGACDIASGKLKIQKNFYSNKKVTNPFMMEPT